MNLETGLSNAIRFWYFEPKLLYEEPPLEIALFYSRFSQQNNEKNVTMVKSELRKWVRNSFGIFLILFGVIGHLIPLLPGSFFIAAGLLLLAENFPSVEKFIKNLETRYSSFHSIVKRLRRKDGSLRVGDVIIIGLIIIGAFLIVGYLVLHKLGYNFLSLGN